MPSTRRTRRILTLVWAGVVAGAGQAGAALCVLDNVPAATLLLPYFEVDPADENGRTTSMSITNAGAQATLAHVVLWTDHAVPTLAFDVYLTGFDVQTVNLRDVFAGRLPATADLADDPDRGISPLGPYSQGATFPGCAGLLPPPPMAPAAVDALRRAHQGLPASGAGGGLCAGHPFFDGLARGYATVDVATRCSTLVPGDLGYFGAGGVAGYANVLFGDFFYLDGRAHSAEGFNLVRVEADAARFGPGDRTFYRTRVGGSGADGREPLPTAWALRFFNGGSFAGATELIAWRDTERPGTPVPCGAPPSWSPLPVGGAVAFDEQEHAAALGPCGASIPCINPPLPLLELQLAASRTAVGASGLNVPYTFGWLYLDLQTAPASAPPPSFIASQSWVGTVSSAGGGYRIGIEATPLDAACAPRAVSF